MTQESISPRGGERGCHGGEQDGKKAAILGAREMDGWLSSQEHLLLSHEHESSLPQPHRVAHPVTPASKDLVGSSGLRGHLCIHGHIWIRTQRHKQDILKRKEKQLFIKSHAVFIVCIY